MHRLFLPKDQFPNISGTDAHYLKDVLRCRIGDQLEIFDGSGMAYTVKITRFGKEQVIFAVEGSTRPANEAQVKVTLAQSLPKGQKMDFVVEKCTELGVHRIIPMLTERSLAKQAKLERWRKLAKEAAEQSGRVQVPAIDELTRFEDVLQLGPAFDLALIPWELEKEVTLKKALTTYRPNDRTSLLIVIGPEGGFTQSETEAAKKAGFIPISLGKRILRTETAGMATLASIIYETETA